VQASARSDEANRNAEAAKARAREAFEQASQALSEAKDLAEQAATAAKEIAAQASEEADRLAKNAQARAAEAKRQVIAPDQLKQPASSGARDGRTGSASNSAARKQPARSTRQRAGV
jgi:F0F1-type ATP synthase membrane subunit b/b'